jgi:hypothetical protein
MGIAVTGLACADLYQTRNIGNSRKRKSLAVAGAVGNRARQRQAVPNLLNFEAMR